MRVGEMFTHTHPRQTFIPNVFRVSATSMLVQESRFQIKRPWRKPATRRPITSVIADAAVAVIGVLSPFTVRIVGMLPMGEIALIAILPAIYLLRKRNLTGTGYLKTSFFILLWLIGQVVTDIYRHTDRISWLKGQANIAFFLLDFLAIAMLMGSSARRKAIFFFALSIGSIAAIRWQPTDYQLQSPWKFGFSLPVAILGLLFCSVFYRLRIYPAIIIPLGTLALVNLLLNFRSGVLFLLITIVLTVPLIPERIGRLKILPRNGSFARVVVLACLAATAGLLALFLVRTATRTGLVSEDAQIKNQTQFQSSLGVLLAGRPEILVSSRAVLDSPILGHGSWARDPKYIEMLSDINVRNGIKMDLSDIEEESRGLIPSHSHFMGAWVFSGILGAVCWGYIFWNAIKGLIAASQIRSGLSPLFVWLLVSMIFDILFSPFGSTARIKEAATLVIALDLIRENAIPAAAALHSTSRRWVRNIAQSRTRAVQLP